nr:hypothetical protein [uncultured Emticicia sp.]
MPSIYFQYELDCIGLNGVLIGAKSISFERSNVILDKDLSHYITLISLLSSTYNKDIKKNNFYLISEEPTVIKSQEHNTWEGAIKNPLFKVIHPNEINIISEKVIETQAHKFL